MKGCINNKISIIKLVCFALMIGMMFLASNVVDVHGRIGPRHIDDGITGCTRHNMHSPQCHKVRQLPQAIKRGCVGNKCASRLDLE